MNSLPALNVAAIQQHLATRAEFDRLVPALYHWIGDAALAKLADLPGMYYVSGPEDLHVVARRMPGRPAILDWVALGFPRWDMYTIHIGCLCDLSQYPIRFNVGFHSLEPAWSLMREDLSRLDWVSTLGRHPKYEVAPAVNEYRWVEPDWLAFDLADLAGSVDQVASLAARYARLVYPLIPRP